MSRKNLQLRARIAIMASSLVMLDSAYSMESVRYVHTDALGSPVAYSDAAGDVVGRTAYEPYGTALGSPDTGGPGFGGHVADSLTSLVYMQQRYYDPDVGAFLSVDPVVAYGGSLATFARYRYANGNPYRFVDPDGRCAMRTGSHICGGGTSSALSVMQVKVSSVEARRNLLAHNGRSKDMPINPETVQDRYEAAVRALDRVKPAVESISHRSKDDAAMTFDAMIQPIIEKYGVEVDGVISGPEQGGLLGGLYVGDRFEKETGIGFSVIGSTNKESSIHGHPLVRDHGGGHSPFSPGHVNWYRTTPGVPHFLTTPNGIYKFNGAASPVEQIGK